MIFFIFCKVVSNIQFVAALYLTTFLFHLCRDPNSNGLPEWPSYDNSEEQYVIIGANITKGRHLKSGATKILNKILNAGSKQLSHSQKLSPFIHITVLFLLLSFVFHL